MIALAPTTTLLLFLARASLCQNVETYRYDVANVTTNVVQDYTVDVTTDIYYSDFYQNYTTSENNTVDEETTIGTPGNYVQSSSSIKQEEQWSSSDEKRYLPICCEPGHYLVQMKCTLNDGKPASNLDLPAIYDSNLSISEMRPEDFLPKYGVPCEPWDNVHSLVPPPEGQDVFFLLENGTIFHDYRDTEYESAWYNEENYCWASVINGNETKTIAAICFGFPQDPEDEGRIMIVKPISMILSLPFFIATFVTYSILEELQNMHGATLRMYVACLFSAYVPLIIVQLAEESIIPESPLCMGLGFVIHFSFLASFFWLNVMCFDIWWTFGGFRSLQGSVKQRERKKFIIYSAYAWGCPTVMTTICVIIQFVPSIPDNWIKPDFGLYGCWFYKDAALGIYFYAPMGLTVICNIFLFISTALKIVQHKKDTAHHLKGMDSRRHDDHKQWFNLYLKLFIVMGINWSMEIVSFIFKENSPHAMWIITDLANALQGLIIFIIFVWKDKIKRLLLKRLGFRDRNFKSGNSSRSAYHSSTSRTTCTAATVMAPLQDKYKHYSEPAKNVTDESDCV